MSTPQWLRLASIVLVLGAACTFVGLGVIFVVSPEIGAAIYGIAAPEGQGAAYLRAIGIRDIAFGLFLAALLAFATRRAVGVALAVTVGIPAGDMLLVFAERGWAGLAHILLHFCSGLIITGLALLLLGQSRPERTDVP